MSVSKIVRRTVRERHQRMSPQKANPTVICIPRSTTIRNNAKAKKEPSVGPESFNHNPVFAGAAVWPVRSGRGKEKLKPTSAVSPPEARARGRMSSLINVLMVQV